MLDGIDDDIELDDDLANDLAKDIWLVVLRENMDNPDSIFMLYQYMKLISANAKGFVYEFTLDYKRKVNGIVWKIATMISNLEIFSSYITLGTMKREINKCLWPYMSVSLYNYHLKMCLACQVIVCGEWHYAYKFLCQFLINHSPGRLPTEFLLVMGDGFFNQEMVKYFGFAIAKYPMDLFHLLYTGLTDTF